MTLTIEIVSDVICPWCFIGKRRLERALAMHAGPVTVRWLPFEMNPQMPKAGISRREYRTKKFGSWERSRELDAEVTAAGEAEGIAFAFDRIERTPNTRACHELIGLADRNGKQDAVVEALFHAYFTAARDIADQQTLLDVVTAAGLDRGEAEATLVGGNGDVFAETDEWARRVQIQGVPFFIINGEITLYGAQSPEALSEAFRKAGALS